MDGPAPDGRARSDGREPTPAGPDAGHRKTSNIPQMTNHSVMTMSYLIEIKKATGPRRLWLFVVNV